MKTSSLVKIFTAVHKYSCSFLFAGVTFTYVLTRRFSLTNLSDPNCQALWRISNGADQSEITDFKTWPWGVRYIKTNVIFISIRHISSVT